MADNQDSSTSNGQQGAFLPGHDHDDDLAPPYAPPDDVDDDLEDTHPRLDTNVDEHELYDEGKEGVTDSEIPDRSGGQDDPLLEDEGERIA